jgi:FeS assembly protein IscX
MNWDDYEAIGEALHQTYPNANHLTIRTDELIALVSRLPGFKGALIPPDPRTLSAVSFAWVAAVAGPDDTGPYDALA